MISSPPRPLEIAIDGQYDSVGYSAELECESVMDVPSKLLLTFAITHKSEVGGISNRMELHGAKKVLEQMNELATIESVTTDKHASVIKYLRDKGITHTFDLWHLLHRLDKNIRTAGKKLSEPEDRQQLIELKRRLLTHIWRVLDLSEGNSTRFKELIYTFFLHVTGVHSWAINARFTELFQIASNTKTSRNFLRLRFTTVTACSHSDLDENASEPIAAASPALQLLLEHLAKTSFLTDVVKVKGKSSTSALEAYHSVRLRYAPKRKFYTKRGAEIKSMLAALHWNTVQLAEPDGERSVVAKYQSFSKPRGKNRTVTRKATVDHDWKRSLVELAIERKRQNGPGLPTINEYEQEDEIDTEAEPTVDMLVEESDSEEELSEDESTE